MGAVRRLGSLERAVMDQLWDQGGAQTVRQVHEALSRQRNLAYNTVMTVLQRLHRKRLVIQIRDDRAYRYLAHHGREELVADLLVDALDQATGRGDRLAALMQVARRVGTEEADALRHALAYGAC